METIQEIQNNFEILRIGKTILNSPNLPNMRTIANMITQQGWLPPTQVLKMYQLEVLYALKKDLMSLEIRDRLLPWTQRLTNNRILYNRVIKVIDEKENALLFGD